MKLIEMIPALEAGLKITNKFLDQRTDYIYMKDGMPCWQNDEPVGLDYMMSQKDTENWKLSAWNEGWKLEAFGAEGGPDNWKLSEYIVSDEIIIDSHCVDCI